MITRLQSNPGSFAARLEPASSRTRERDMDAEETEACARVLLVVAYADGKIDPEERRLLELFGGDPRAPSDVVNLEAELAKLKSLSSRERTLRAAIVIAYLDGHCTPGDRVLLTRIHAKLASSSELSLAELHAETRAEMEEVREVLEEATIAFLHEIGQRGRQLSQQAYEALAKNLNEKKREILRSVVG